MPRTCRSLLFGLVSTLLATVALAQPLTYVTLRVAGGNLAFDQYSSFAAVAKGKTSAPETTQAWGTWQPRALTADGERWYAILRNGASNCFVTYTSYENMRTLKGHVLRCNAVVGDGFRGVAYDGRLFYTLFWDGSRHWWQSYLSWDDVVANNFYSSQSDARSGDAYKAIGFDASQQAFFAMRMSGATLWMDKYATLDDMIALRPSDGSKVSTTADQFVGMAVGNVEPALDVYLFAGQSNAVGWDTDGAWLPADAADANIRFFYRIGNGHDTAVSTSGSTPATLAPQSAAFRSSPPTNFGIEMGAARALFHGGRTDMAVVKTAWGGTSLAGDWNPTDPASLSQVMQANLAQAESQWAHDPQQAFHAHVAGVFWMQGEADAGDPTTAAAYEGNLRRFIAMTRAWARDPQLPFVIGRIRQTPWPYSATVRAAEAAVAASVPHVALVDTDGLTLFPGDSGHFSSDSEYALGNLMAAAFQQLAGW